MKTRALTTLILCRALTALAAGIDGKWIREMQVGDADGKTYTHQTLLTLKAEGSVLTGTAVQTSAAPWMRELTGRPIEIYDGKIDGDKYSFKLKIENQQGERVSVYEGTLNGDKLSGTVKYRGIGITQPFEAQRVK
jgi:hypothetical protein